MTAKADWLAGFEAGYDLAASLVFAQFKQRALVGTAGARLALDEPADPEPTTTHPRTAEAVSGPQCKYHHLWTVDGCADGEARCARCGEVSLPTWVQR